MKVAEKDKTINSIRHKLALTMTPEELDAAIVLIKEIQISAKALNLHISDIENHLKNK